MMEKNTEIESSFELELTKIQFELHLYISKLCGSFQASRDILQEVNLQLCRRRVEWNPARGSLMAWAVTLAKYEVLHWRDKEKENRLAFDSAWIEEVSETMEEEVQLPLERRLALLDSCMAKMKPRLRDLLVAHHVRHESVKKLAERLGRTPHSLANSLYSIRASLRECIERKAKSEAELS